jgi:hypothetical protein
MRLNIWYIPVNLLKPPAWCLAAVVMGIVPARAQSLSASPSATQILQQFNAVIFNGFTSTADVEGRTVIGGSMSGGASFAINPAAEAASAFAALTVYGNETSSNSFNLNLAESVAIAGNNAGTFNLNSGGNIFIGGSNTGALNSSGGTTALSVLGSNSGSVNLNGSGSVYIGGSNNAAVSINGGSAASDSISINGNNNSSLTLNNGGTVKVNGNAGSGNLNGGSGRLEPEQRRHVQQGGVGRDDPGCEPAASFRQHLRGPADRAVRAAFRADLDRKRAGQRQPGHAGGEAERQRRGGACPQHGGLRQQ